MKISLTTFGLVTTLALPLSLATAIYGVDLPDSFSLAAALGLFLTAFILLTFAADYSRASTSRRKKLAADTAFAATSARATEERRLAA